ncbi:MAG: hypothetical protein GX558_01205 [Clostridiales bacterium]|nr:hypothetical protein [Clostridiales bacterium]
MDRAHDLRVVLDASADPRGALSAFDRDPSDARITLIAEDGAVLYDNRADESTLPNHLDRPEVRQALATGVGQGGRLSATLDEQTVYVAVRLDNGSVLRIAYTRSNLWGMARRMLALLALIALGALAASLLAAGRMTRALVRPINDIDLNRPLDKDVYEELSPLLHRIAALGEQIRQKEQALGERRQEFDAITAGMGEGLILVGPTGALVSVNKAAAAMLGATGPGDGASPHAAGPADRAGGLWALSRDLELNRAVEGALAGVGAQYDFARGGRRYRAYVSPVRHGDRPGGAVALLTDVTDRARAERLRREFSANVSHELKTPLTSISGYAEMLEGGMVHPEDIPATAGRIRAEAGRMIALVTDIMKLSSLDERALQPGDEVIDLAGVAREVVERLADRAASRGVALSLDAQPATVRGAPGVVGELVACLLDNAILYNKTGGSAVVRVRGSGAGALLEVADTGIGIPPEHRQRVFERFYRVDKSRSKQTGGTGLGLSIAKHIAEYCGGRISLTSEVDAGTTVRVEFPPVALAENGEG